MELAGSKVVYILFHTGMRISEFCGLTLKDIDLQNKTVNIDHQLQRTADMKYIVVETKTDAGKRKIPITDDVAAMFQAIIEDREAPAVEKIIDGYTGFLFYDKEGKPLVAMHWQHRFNNMVNRYNDIYRIQMPNITPHVCRHTYCRLCVYNSSRCVFASNPDFSVIKKILQTNPNVFEIPKVSISFGGKEYFPK